MSERVAYDEFSYFHENAKEFGLPYDGPPTVRRERVDLGDGRALSALVWGTGEPELVLVHGGAQNAHTWDTVAMALGRPLVAIDLPGHGHSDGPKDGRSTDPRSNAEDVAVVVRALAPNAASVVGMSLGGMTSIALCDLAPDLVRKLVLVDVTPGVTGNKASQIIAFINGPESFPSFAEILERTVQFNPTRTESSLRRGILHNAVQRDDGSWVWRHARHRAEQAEGAGDLEARQRDFGSLWDAISAYAGPVMLCRGMREQSVVDDADEAELVKRRPDARIEHVAEAGHSLQGDTPLELAALIEDFVF
jgi:pimeloyl-ACP methyl ester carboxylesterase